MYHNITVIHFQLLNETTCHELKFIMKVQSSNKLKKEVFNTNVTNPSKSLQDSNLTHKKDQIFQDYLTLLLTDRIESLIRASLDNDLTVFEITRFNCRLLHNIKRKAKNTTLSVPFQNSRNIGKIIPLTHIDMTAHLSGLTQKYLHK